MSALDWLNRDAAFSVAEAVSTRALCPHAAGHVIGEPGDRGNLKAMKALLPFYRLG